MHEQVGSVLHHASTTYRVHHHTTLGAMICGPQDFADALGYEIGRVAKTLLVRSRDRATYGVVVIGSNQRADLAQVANVLGMSRVHLATEHELARTLGYPRTGVSPLGFDHIPVLLDEGLLRYPTILIGAGEAGVEVELPPSALVALAHAVVVQLADDISGALPTATHPLDP